VPARQVPLTWEDVEDFAKAVALRWIGRMDEFDNVWGVPRGGVLPAMLVAKRLGKPMVRASERNGRTLIVDDLVDSGATWNLLGRPEMFDALVRKTHSPPDAASAAFLLDGWAVFPWEEDEQFGPEANVTRLLEYIGEDPSRDGLIDTPRRVVKAWVDMTAGYAMDPALILATTFDVAHDEMVVVEGIEFSSLCEHHVLPFTGTCTIGYVPGDRIVGLSKLARLVEVYAQRLQVQERMTEQIAHAIEEHLQPRGVGVVVRAAHSCMGCRGIRKPSARMVTSALSGFMKDDEKARSEFLALARASNGIH